MTSYELIITDVTCYGSLFCVAGWDPALGKMIRPEPPTSKAESEASRFWGSDRAGPGKQFAVGNVVKLTAEKPPDSFLYPHATEDRIVTSCASIRITRKLKGADFLRAVNGSISLSIGEAFDSGLQRTSSGKAYVQAGYKGRSLGAVELSAKNIKLREDAYDPQKPKLRAIVEIGGSFYDLPITAETVKTYWRSQGIEALKQEIAKSDQFHIRLGLARPFPDNECYCQINGLYGK